MNRTGLWVPMVLLAGCQTYTFEQVEPLFYQNIRVLGQRGARPNVMVLVDRSGSMGLPINPNDSACPKDCGTGGSSVVCPVACKTRISELKVALSQFFTDARTTARFGLALFPEQPKGTSNEELCTAASSNSLVAAIPDDAPDTDENVAAWATQADSLSSFVNSSSLQIGGGTPTSASLKYVATTPALSTVSSFERARVVFLLTDGLPNCVGPTLGANDPNVVTAVAQLKTAGILTAVIGFGSDVSGATTLNDMARAGGLPQKCSNGLTCEAGDTCGADSVCGHAAYSASNATELTKALDALRGQIEGDPCVKRLAGTPEHVAVSHGHENVMPGPDTWAVSGSTITFTGKLCQLIKDATPNSDLNLTIGAW